MSQDLIKGVVYVSDPLSTMIAVRGAVIDPAFDVQGRLITYPYAIRGSVSSVSTTMQNNTTHPAQANNECTIIDASTTYFNDIVYISGTNGSDQAIRLVFRENYNGANQFRLQMAANATEELKFQVPWRQSEKDMNWRADYEVYGGVTNVDDVTNTTITLALQYIQNL